MIPYTLLLRKRKNMRAIKTEDGSETRIEFSPEELAKLQADESLILIQSRLRDGQVSYFTLVQTGRLNLYEDIRTLQENGIEVI